MKKMSVSLLSLAFLFSALLPAQTYDREKLWEKEIAFFVEMDQRQTPPENAVLFVGSSSIRVWKNLRESFPNKRIINRGFGGSRLEDVNHYFDRLVARFQPKSIVLYAGENDVATGVAPETVRDQYRKFSALVRQRWPKTKIFYLSLKPSPRRWEHAQSFRQTNDLIRAEIRKDRQAQFVDVWTAMLGADGTPMQDIFAADRLHLNEKGYAIWTALLLKMLP